MGDVYLVSVCIYCYVYSAVIKFVQVLLFLRNPAILQEPGSLISIVSGYGLDDGAFDVESPAEARGFFL
jgi:hypothetical protein